MVLIDVGLPLFGIAAMIISTWTTNSTNAYSGGLNIVMAFNLKDNKRREATLIAGILGIVLCNIGVLSHIEGVLSLLSYVVCPIGGRHHCRLLDCRQGQKTEFQTCGWRELVRCNFLVHWRTLCIFPCES